jgi:epoxyqueuosine reductase QueG
MDQPHIENAEGEGSPLSLFRALKEALLKEGAAFVSCADLRDLPPDLREHFPRGISIGVAFKPAVVTGLLHEPSREFDSEFERTSTLRKTLSTACTGLLHTRGYEAITVPANLSQADPRTLTARLPHKTVATLSGAGWIGKCALLVTERYGSALRLVSVLTNADLPVGTPVEESLCGNCKACVDICPAGAPTGYSWHAGMPRQSLFDAFACQKWNRHLRESTNFRHPYCVKCIAICPWTQKYVSRRAGSKTAEPLNDLVLREPQDKDKV